MIVALLLLLTSNPVDDGWEKAGHRSGVLVYTRAHGSERVNETLSIGTIDQPPWVVKNAIDDYEARDGVMPYIKENRVIRRDEKGTLIYHRTSPPLVSDRDYTIWMFDASFVRADGVPVYVTRWNIANAEGPPVRSGCVRVEESEGYWRLEPLDDGKKTRASYFVFANAGGMVPSAFVELATLGVMAEIFDAIRVRAAVPKYAVTRPPMPTLKEPALADKVSP